MRIGIAVVALALLVAPLAAQGHGPKRYAVAPGPGVVVTREVLGRKGFEVIPCRRRWATTRSWWYRAGKPGPPRPRQRTPAAHVIRRDPVANKVVFLQTPSPILVDIDVKLR